MNERKLDVQGAAGTAEGFLYTPDGAGPWPGLIFLTDIFGVRPANQDMAKRIAEGGYAVLMPNIFYRTDKLPILDFAFKMGEERSMKRVHELLGAFNAAQMAEDGAAYADFLLAQREVHGGRVAVVGYCFTGQMALRAAAKAPDRIAAAASFHGGHLVTDQPDSPHRLLPRVKAELYFGHAVEDPSMTPEAVAVLDEALRVWGGIYKSEVYEGARHGWTVPGRDVYNPQQSERHFEKLFALLKRALD